MTFRLFSYAFATCFLLSCTPIEQDNYAAYHHGADKDNQPIKIIENQPKHELPILSDSKGFNVNMMDSHLAEMVDEASNIEVQVSQLLQQLSELRSEIAGYALIKKQIVSADPYETVPVMDAVEPSAPAIESPMPLVEETAAPVDIEKPKQPAAPKVVEKSPAGNGVTNVRYGKHSNKTRLVFDINGSTNHDVNFDREVGLVTVTLPETQWSTENTKMYKANQLSGYEAKNEGQGTVIAMGVANTSSVKTLTLSKPNRLVIDLMK